MSDHPPGVPTGGLTPPPPSSSGWPTPPPAPDYRDPPQWHAAPPDHPPLTTPPPSPYPPGARASHPPSTGAPPPPPPRVQQSRTALWAGLAAFLVVVLSGSVYVLTPRPAVALRPAPAPSAAATPLPSSAPAATATPTVAPATDGGVISRAPSALPTGQEQFGPSTRPVPWTAVADDGTASVAVIPGGVYFTLDSAGVYQYLTAPVSAWYPNTTVAGDVRFVARANNNGIGLGCRSDDGTVVYAFFIHADQTWGIEKQGSAVPYPTTLASGVSMHIQPVTGVNHLAIFCGSGSASAVALMFSINGTPVADLTTPSVANGWSPTVNLCSCSGADTGQFTSVSQATG